MQNNEIISKSILSYDPSSKRPTPTGNEGGLKIFLGGSAKTQNFMIMIIAYLALKKMLL